jgi:hypothetical protein
MGIRFRKSFKAGPVRVNLSKSGIGFSAGVEGARAGVGPRGAYIGGGKGGIYFREQLGAKYCLSIMCPHYGQTLNNPREKF